jgi:hypothetical protein
VRTTPTRLSTKSNFRRDIVVPPFNSAGTSGFDL